MNGCTWDVSVEQDRATGWRPAWWLLACLLALPAAPAAADDCPPEKLPSPRYPFEMMKRNVSGEVLVRARFDACGRVVEASIETGSGHKALDAAALEAVRDAVFSKVLREQVDGDVAILPIEFAGVTTIVPRVHDIGWPASHSRPRYVPSDVWDTAAGPVNILEDWLVLKPAYRRTLHAFYRHTENPHLYRLTLWRQPKGRSDGPEVLSEVEYRLDFDGPVPVVRVSIKCALPEKECEQARRFVLEGLPFAKPRKE